MKDIKKTLQQYCEKTGNTFLDYSEHIAIVTLNLADKRKHEVHSYQVERDGVQLIEFMAKVCDLEKQEVNYKEILQLNQQWCCYSRFVIYGGMLQCAASAHYNDIQQSQIESMLIEVGKLADQMELELTGEDVF
jgi:hypothetical protein